MKNEMFEEDEKVIKINKSYNYYAQCTHTIKKDDEYCGCCGKKVIRVWSEKELNGYDIEDVVASWTKNKKPWELEDDILKLDYYNGVEREENAKWFEEEIMEYAYILLDEWQDKNINATDEEINAKINQIISHIQSHYVIPLEKINRKKLLRD